MLIQSVRGNHILQSADVTAGKCNIEFGMSQSKLHCANVGDGPIQLDLIQMDDYFADSCVISPTAFLILLHTW